MGERTSTKNRTRYEDAMHALCPYFAMFPPAFARKSILKYSKVGDIVLDPFSGRGTTLFEARLLGRIAIANDINPVAVTITRAKSNNLDSTICISEINKLEKQFIRANKIRLRKKAKSLPIFFRHAFHPQTFLQILWLRNKLRNVTTPEAVFIRTLCLSHLHGETQKTKLVYFSNNLPHTYCPRPGYSIQFWKDRKMKAPAVNVFEVLRDRCLFRLQNSRQADIQHPGYVTQGDVRELSKNVKALMRQKVKLVVTSPPYLRITSYEEDQWLRLWFLGGKPYPRRGKITKDDQITSKERYINFLADAWREIRKVVKPDAKVVCRMGQSSRDNFPLKEIMRESIRRGGGQFKIIRSNFSRFKENRQAVLFGSGNVQPSGEYDFVLRVAK